MRLRYLELSNFKNHASREFQTEKKFVAFTGLNGSGKTNILDAIFYLCFTKSYFNNIEIYNVKHEKSYFRLASIWTSNNEEVKIVAQYNAEKKQKKILFDDLPYKKFSDHIGKIPVVMIAPDDQLMMLQFSEERRKYIDITISQMDRLYFENLNRYNRILKQRNALLKSFVERGTIDESLLNSYDAEIIESGTYIHEKRKEVSTQINNHLCSLYKTISGDAEKAELSYVSQISDNTYKDILEQSLHADKYSGRTTKGIHKDDLEFLLNGTALRKFGSQGQQKSFLLSLKIAQLELLFENNKVAPIIIIDDIFAKLDEERVRNLLSILRSDKISQIFISDTSQSRIENVFQHSDEIEIFELTAQ
ncbi:MAG: DNA replication and repair protein RecF [Chitinophagales bacterium]|nr:DNA replication and repair protein RecF [Chitinophagales bacterium]